MRPMKKIHIIDKKKVYFNVPLELMSSQVLSEGTTRRIMSSPMKVLRCLLFWAMSVFTELETKGQKVTALYDYCFNVDENGNLVKVNPPEINPETEELCKSVALFISINKQ